MLSIQHLYQSINELETAISEVDAKKPCLVQIFTSILQPEEAVALAKQVKEKLPFAHVIGSSVSGVIYRGKQHDQHTMIAIEQYKNCTIGSYLISTADQDAKALATSLQTVWSDGTPKLLRLFLGAYYGEAHQLMGCINEMIPGMQVVGGMSGELFSSKVLPFVFNDETSLDCGLICAGIAGEFSTYNRINTAHERISVPHTITKADGRIIYEIEGETAQNWLQKNLGFKSNQHYDSWEDIANNDPLVRFQLALEDHKKATRFIHFDESSKEISQYFTQLEAGTKFRLSYTSPAKCVEECKQTCMEVMETPIEQLFCYNCLFRKLYLKNCAQWELSPYHKNPISGIFLLGEFGCHDGVNEVLNGSCVLSGICEEERYLQVDMARFGQLDSIREENEGLFDYLINKQTQANSAEHSYVLSEVLTHERNQQGEFNRFVDSNLNLSNMLQYDLDCVEYGFDKLCLIKIDNADILISFMGQSGYIAQVKEMVRKMEESGLSASNDVFVYSASLDTFLIAATSAYSQDAFITLVKGIEVYSDKIQSKFTDTPIITRYVVVSGKEYLLTKAYTQSQLHKNSQSRMVIALAKEQDNTYTKKELDTIKLIQYALTENHVIPYYQGLYNNTTGKIDRYEALMRIQNQNGDILTPYHFMDISKKYRLYLDLNLKMFEAVLEDFSTIDCPVNINICAHDINSLRYRQALRERLKTFHKPENITFEILEDEYFSDMEELKEFIAEVRSYGAKIAVDDFGSGYSNLLELVRIQPDYLKIDGEIIREVHKQHEHEIIVSVISSLAKQLAIGLVAEFVENEEIQAIVEKYEVLRSQGYLFSKPQPFAEVYRIEKKQSI